MSTTPDLQALFSRLSSASTSASSPQPQSLQYPNPAQVVGEPGVAAAAAPLSPSAVSRPNTLPRSNMTSPSQGASSGSNDRAQSLLSLLRFSQPTAERQTQQSEQVNSQNTPLGALAAEPVTGSAPPAAIPVRDENIAPTGSPLPQTTEFSAPKPAGSAQENPQNVLLRLLSRSQLNNSQASQNESRKSPLPRTPIGDEMQQNPTSTSIHNCQQSPVAAHQQRDGSPFRTFGSVQSREGSPFESLQVGTPQAQKENKPIFTYTNPFEALNASRSQSTKPQTPQPRISSPALGARRGDSKAPAVNGDKRTSDENSPERSSTRRKLTPKIPGRSTMSVRQETPEASLLTQSVPDSESAKTLRSIETEGKEAVAGPEKPSTVDNSRQKEANVADRQPHFDNVEIKMEDNVSAFGTKQNPHTTIEVAKDAEDAWESAEDSPAKEDRERVVPVYNFPIKPFVSITMQRSPLSTVGLRDDGIMEISRLKKEFDQLDRSLAAATSKYITYSLVKNGGIRIIRQDDGNDRQVFKNSQDRIFSVAVCTTSINAAPSDYQAVLGVGVSGSVYYATISKDGKDLFEDDTLESESLIFPPYPLGDENTSGGVLKTRAKKSSRHPEFFAIGRGKSINLIWPATAMISKYGVGGTSRKVDVEKLYKDRALRITTGKAGKDFAFSEDDTLIVSLDKTGRLRFWDVRPLVEESNATASKVAPVEVRTPLLTLATASPAEKSWPTSVLFIDKLRPYTKVAALRYVLVGLKQNHTLQLWDIGLGKAVQELNFPHESETDGICSVSYHPNTGIVILGHPTRNSIYFIHLSAPRYALTPMTQATYLERVAFKDPDLPKPDSTACMSGIREISFATKGQLRSVELLPIHKGPELTKDATDMLPLFELYVVHSRGVTCLNIRKEDLGWSTESKVLHPVNATEEGLITIKDLRLGTVIDEPVEPEAPAEDEPHPAKTPKKKSSKKAIDGNDDNMAAAHDRDTVPAAPVKPGPGSSNGVKSDDATRVETPVVKENKKGKKKSSATNTLSAADEKETHEPSRIISPSKQIPSDTTAQAQDASITSTMDSTNKQARTLFTSTSAGQGDPDRVTVGISGDWLDKELKKIENGVSGMFRKELADLYQHFQSDRNVQDAAAVARQEAVLRLMSTTLSTNTEKTLQRIIMTQMQQVVVPSITAVTVQAVSAQVGEAIARVLHQLVPHELGTQLPVAINTAMQNPQMSRIISDTVSQKIAIQVESHMSDLLRTTIAPSLRKLTTSAAEKTAAEVEHRFSAQLQQSQAEREKDSAKIDELVTALTNMANHLQSMSKTQVEFQAKILSDRRRLDELSQLAGLDSARSSRQVSTARQLPALVAPPTPVRARSVEDIEVEEIGKLMEDGAYENASISWLQSSQPVELFDKLFVRFTPDYLASDVSALVAFSVGITVGNSLSTNTAPRLDWINAAFGAVDLRDPEIADLSQHAPALINSLIQRLQALYSETTERNPNDQLLRKIVATSHKAMEMKANLSGEHQYQSYD